MKFVALISGGKDSIYSIQVLKSQGHIPVGLLYMKNDEEYVDSYMYQTVGSEVVKYFGDCLDLPLFVYNTKCQTINKELNYKSEQNDEVEDLHFALSEIRNKIEFEGVSSGAILSRYQKNRVENVTQRLNLTSLAPLWQRNQKELLKEMIDSGIKAILIKIASPSLNKSFLGKDLKYVYEKNEGLDENFCGEGGEYETIVLDCEMFKKRIEFDDTLVSCHPEESFESAIVFFLKFNNLKIAEKL